MSCRCATVRWTSAPAPQGVVVMLRRAVHAAGVIGLLGACGGGGSPGPPTREQARAWLPACGVEPVLTQLAVPIAEVHSIQPLGLTTGGTSHIFPSDHNAFYARLSSPGDPASTLVMPGHAWITSAQVNVTGNRGQFTEYTLRFAPCREIDMYFAHVASIDPAIASRLGPLDQHCTRIVSGNFMEDSCHSRPLRVEVAAGTPLGTWGPIALDFGAYDARVTLRFANIARVPDHGNDISRRHTVCATNYYPPSIRAQLEPLWGDPFDRRRTAEPRCGTYAMDVPGTAQGKWYRPGLEPGGFYDENEQLALVPNDIDPAVLSLSVSARIPGMMPGSYRRAAASSGRVNRSFDQLTPDGNVYCYDGVASAQWGDAILLVQLPTATTIRVERQTSIASCGAGPWAFTSMAVTFER